MFDVSVDRMMAKSTTWTMTRREGRIWVGWVGGWAHVDDCMISTG